MDGSLNVSLSVRVLCLYLTMTVVTLMLEKCGKSAPVVYSPCGSGFISCCRRYAGAECGESVRGGSYTPRFTAFFTCNIKTAALLDAFDSRLLLHCSLYYCIPCNMVFALTSLSLISAVSSSCQFYLWAAS